MRINIPGPYLPDLKSISLEGIKKNTYDMSKALEQETKERIQADKRSLIISIIALVLASLSAFGVIVQIILGLL